MEVVASLSQGRTAAAQCDLFTYKSVLVIFEPPCIYATLSTLSHDSHYRTVSFAVQISTQNMYTDCRCVEISPQELLKILHT